jgi:hypothetical protein
MMGRFRSTQFAQRFFRLSLAQGERMKVRGSNELALNQSSPSPLLCTRRGDLVRAMSYKSFETKHEQREKSSHSNRRSECEDRR